MKTPKLLQTAGEDTSITRLQMSPVSYGRTNILLEILAGFQYSPPGHTPKLSIPIGLTTLSPNSWFYNKQIMNPSCTVVFVTNMPSIMSTIVTTTLHGIPMMGTLLAMILIKDQNSQETEETELSCLLSNSRTAPGCSRTALDALEQLKNHLYKSGYYSKNSTRTSRDADRLLFTAQSRTLCRITIQKSKGTIHCS